MSKKKKIIIIIVSVLAGLAVLTVGGYFFLVSLFTGAPQLDYGELTLVADFSNGSEEPNRKEYTHTYDDPGNDGPSVEDIAEGLSELTGFDFTLLDVGTVGDTGIAIDWSPDSTLIATLGEREQKEDFRFFDYDSMAWFMLDSLCQSILKNLPETEEVYYTMVGGKELYLENLSPPMSFTLDTPYMGSAFYFAHEDGRGDLLESEGGHGDLIELTEEQAEFILTEALGEQLDGAALTFISKTENGGK